MIDLEHALRELGDLLDVDDPGLQARVVDALAGTPRARRASLWLVAAAIVALVAAVIAIPPARGTVRSWLGLDRVEVERRDDLVVPETVPPIPRAPASAPPGASTVPPTTNALAERAVVVDGTTVRLGTIDGRLDDASVGKTATVDATVVSLAIDGMPALWIEEPHEVVVERDGEPVLQRVAGATLLWQDGDVLWRVEGFATLDDAIAFVRSR